MPKGLYAFVPAFNEAPTLEKVLSDLVKLRKAGEIAGICVVNDGSTDYSTREIAESFRKHGVKVMHNKRNMGKGWCFYKAARWAHNQGAEYFGMLDADLEGVPEKQLRRMKKAMSEKEVDMAIGKVYSHMIYEQPKFSGQRIIRMRALKPLIIGNKNWRNLIAGIDAKTEVKKTNGKRTGKKTIKTHHRRSGYGLEFALNYLIGTVSGKTKESMSAPNIKIAEGYFFAGALTMSKNVGSKQWFGVTKEPDITEGKIKDRMEKAIQERKRRAARNLSERTIRAHKKALAHALRHRNPR